MRLATFLRAGAEQRCQESIRHNFTGDSVAFVGVKRAKDGWHQMTPTIGRYLGIPGIVTVGDGLHQILLVNNKQVKTMAALYDVPVQGHQWPMAVRLAKR